jgi:hypothetical protein
MNSLFPHPLFLCCPSLVLSDCREKNHLSPEDGIAGMKNSYVMEKSGNAVGQV